MTVGAAAGSGARAPWVLLILALGALLYLPNLDRDEIDNEEGRRAIPAREMIRSGDYVLPTVWRRPYLNKPPLFMWLVAAASTVTGGVDEVAVRLPSAIATVLTALGLFLVGSGARSRGSPRAGGLAAVLFLVAPATFAKGTLGELEATLVLSVLAVLALLPRVPRGGAATVVATGLCLGAALLVKGPPVLVFLGAGLVALAWSERDARVLASPRLALALLIGLLVAGAWVLLLLREVPSDVVFGRWASETSRAGTASAEAWLGERWSFAVGIVLGFLPASLVLLLGGRGVAREASFERYVLGVIALSLLFFAVYPGTRGRYAHPVLPWCCLAAGAALDGALLDRSGRPFARVRRASLVALVLLGVGAAAGATALVRPIDGVRLGLVGASLALVLALVVAAGLRAFFARRESAIPLAAVVAGLACLRLVQLTEVVPQQADLRGRRALAAGLERLLPPDEPVVRLHVPEEYNALFYVRRDLRWIDEPSRAEPGEVVVVAEGVLDPELVSGWDVLGRAPLEHRTAVVLRGR